MTLYEINKQIEDLIEKSIDPETGEFNLDEQTFESLQIAKEQKIENIALFIKNLTAEAKAIKEEEQNLASRRKSIENKTERLKTFLSDALNGESFKTARASITWRKTKSVEVDDDFVDWAMINDSSLLRFSDPVADKIALKKALASGEDIPCARIVESESMTVK